MMRRRSNISAHLTTTTTTTTSTTTTPFISIQRACWHILLLSSLTTAARTGGGFETKEIQMNQENDSPLRSTVANAAAAAGTFSVTTTTTHHHYVKPNQDKESLSSSSSLSSLLLMKFDDWLRLHQKTYETVEEMDYRRMVFAQNAQVVARHNAAYKAGLTSFQMTTASPFADLTDDEFTDLYLMEPQHCSATTKTTTTSTETKRAQPSLPVLAQSIQQARRSVHDIPYSQTDSLVKEDDDDDDDDNDLHVDWRTHGVVTPIKNQGHCGSCWTFSTTGCLESHMCLMMGGSRTDCPSWTGLSEQQLVDCAGAYNNFGCSGGLPSQAYEYIKFNQGHGLDLETSYPYHAQETGYCRFYNRSRSSTNPDDLDPKDNDDDDDNDQIGGQVLEVYNITSQAEGDLEYAIAHIGPVSIAYQVAPDFRFYAHGVYDSYNATSRETMCSSAADQVNHAVVAVGLGRTVANNNDDDSHPNNVTGGLPYYIVRNSWGTQWGMEGYFWMKRGQNLCGVSDCASFPIVPTTTTSPTGITSRNAVAEDSSTAAAAATTTTTTTSRRVDRHLRPRQSS